MRKAEVVVVVAHSMVTSVLVDYLEYLDENDHAMTEVPVEIDVANHKDVSRVNLDDEGFVGMVVQMTINPVVEMIVMNHQMSIDWVNTCEDLDCNVHLHVLLAVPNGLVLLDLGAFYYSMVVVVVVVEIELDDHFPAYTVEFRIVLANVHVLTLNSYLWVVNSNLHDLIVRKVQLMMSSVVNPYRVHGVASYYRVR